MGNRGRVLAVVVLLVVGAGLGGLLVHALGGGADAGRVVAQCSDDRGDADRIQDAVDGSEEGDEVVFSGRCLVDRTITLLGGRAYRGESQATTLTAAPGSNLRAVLASDSWVLDKTTTGNPISLSDLTVDAARADNPRGGDGVVIRSWDTQIEDVRITRARDACLRITSVSRNGTDLGTNNTQVNGAVRGLFAYHCGEQGIYVEDPGNAVTDWHLVGNTVGDTGGDGIQLENAGGWTIEANHVFDAAGSGIDAFRLFATTVADNYVEDFGTGSGIAAYAQGAAGSTVVGNRVFQAGDRQGGTLLALTTAPSGTSTLAVTGNVLIGNGTGTGLSYESQGATLRVTSVGNSISQVQVPTSGPAPDAGY